MWYNTIELEFFLMRRELSSFACDAPARSFADRLATEGVLGLFLAFYVFIRYDVSKRFMPPSVHHLVLLKELLVQQKRQVRQHLSFYFSC